jgi:hypothetical protein
MITENMKAKYEVIAENSNGIIRVVHNMGYPSLKEVYTSKSEFYKDLDLVEASGTILEPING